MPKTDALLMTEQYLRARTALDADLAEFAARGHHFTSPDRNPTVRHILTIAWAVIDADPVSGLDEAERIVREGMRERSVC